MNNFWTYWKNRLMEPSTWRGLIALLGSLGLVLTSEQADKIVAAALAGIGVINVFKKDASSPDSKTAKAITEPTKTTITINQP